MDSAFIHQAANELVQTAGTRNIKQIARSCSLDISETSRNKDMLGLLSLNALDRHQHPVTALAVQAVIIIIDGDKSYAKQWKHLLQILTCFHEITTQSGEVLYHNAVDFPLLQCFQQPFKFRAVKICSCAPFVRKYIQQHQVIPMVNVLLDIGNLHFQ